MCEGSKVLLCRKESGKEGIVVGKVVQQLSSLVLESDLDIESILTSVSLGRVLIFCASFQWE